MSINFFAVDVTKQDKLPRVAQLLNTGHVGVLQMKRDLTISAAVSASFYASA